VIDCARVGLADGEAIHSSSIVLMGGVIRLVISLQLKVIS